MQRFRRRYRKRTTTKRRRYGVRRKKAIFRKKTTTHTFTRRLNATQLQSAIGPGVVSGGYTFALSNLPDYTEFTSLYDQFRIKWVKVKFIFQTQVAETAPVNSPGMFYSVIDLDDASAPTLSYCQSAKWAKLTQAVGTHTRFLRPRTLTQLYNGLGSAYAVNKIQWLDCDYANTPHYGLKYFWYNCTFERILADVEMQFCIEFRDPL